MVMIMQRVHERDPSGYILSNDLGWVHLCLPARFERRHPYLYVGDRRTHEGELLFPSRFDDEALSRMTKEMTEYAISGQLQQRPVPREGGLFKRHWFNRIKQVPAGTVWVRGWDLASTEENVSSSDPDYTACVLMGRTPAGQYVIKHAQRERYGPTDVENFVKSMAKLDGPYVKVRMPKDPGQAGKAQANAFAKVLAGYVCRFVPPSGSKVMRAEPLASQGGAGNLFIVDGPWNEEFIEELCLFPNGAHDDWVDAASDAFDELANPRGRADSIPGAW